MVLVKSVKPITDGWLYVTFDNEEQKIVDIKPHLKGLLSKLQDPDFFKQVFVDPELETVSWPGELDLDPDNLYKQGININVIKTILSEEQREPHTIKQIIEKEHSLSYTFKESGTRKIRGCLLVYSIVFFNH